MKNQTETKVYYDNKGQYERVRAYLIDGETLSAVLDVKGGGTGFIGLSDRRLIFYDQGILLKKKSMVSIPYNQIIAVASADEGVIFQTSEITLVTAAGRFTFEFWGAEKAHRAYRYIMQQILSQASPQMPG
jgi:hypothetical protein